MNEIRSERVKGIGTSKVISVGRLELLVCLHLLLDEAVVLSAPPEFLLLGAHLLLERPPPQLLELLALGGGLRVERN